MSKGEPVSFLKYVMYLVKYLKKVGSLDVRVANPESLARDQKPLADKSTLVHIPSLGDGAFPRVRLLVKLKVLGFKVIVTLHGFVSQCLRLLCKKKLVSCPYEHCSVRQILIDAKNKLLWRTLQGLIDCVITPSNSAKRDSVQYLGVQETKIYVIYHGVDHELYRPYPESKCYDFLQERYKIDYDFILHVSSYQPKKNIERVIAAYALLRKKYGIQEKLVIIGKQPKERLLSLASDLGLSSKDIIFVDAVPERHLPYFYSAAKVFVFPSLYEGFGMPILEAMACGCPVVTSNVFACPEIAGDAALLVDPFNVKEIATAILSILEDQDLREELVMRGLRRTKQFTWERAALMHLRVYGVIAGL